MDALIKFINHLIGLNNFSIIEFTLAFDWGSDFLKLFFSKCIEDRPDFIEKVWEKCKKINDPKYFFGSLNRLIEKNCSDWTQKNLIHYLLVSEIENPIFLELKKDHSHLNEYGSLLGMFIENNKFHSPLNHAIRALIRDKDILLSIFSYNFKTASLLHIFLQSIASIALETTGPKAFITFINEILEKCRKSKKSTENTIFTPYRRDKLLDFLLETIKQDVKLNGKNKWNFLNDNEECAQFNRLVRFINNVRKTIF